MLGDERDAGAEAQPLRHGRRGGEGDERVERAAVLLGQLGPPGHGVRRLVGMWVCSVTHSDSKPRASSSAASRSGRIERSVGKISAPMCIGGTVRRTAVAGPDAKRPADDCRERARRDVLRFPAGRCRLPAGWWTGPVASRSAAWRLRLRIRGP